MRIVCTTASGHGLPSRLPRHHDRCTPVSRRVSAPPNSSEPGAEEPPHVLPPGGNVMHRGCGHRSSMITGNILNFVRRQFLHLAASAASLATLPFFSARAQSWPSGAIRIVVPFPPGGSTDVIARLAQPGLQQRLGTTIILEN